MRNRGTRESRRAFTLIELVIVIGIIVLLMGLTVFAVAAMAKDSKMASATNAVQAALERARAMALREGQPVLVTMLPHIDEDFEHLRIVYAIYSGQSYLNRFDPDPNRWFIVDRFVPLTGFEHEALPRAMKVAAPAYFAGAANDGTWVAASTIAAISNTNEAPGYLVAVMFDADGSLITRNARTDSNRIFVDFNNDGFQWYGGNQNNDPANFADTLLQIDEEDEPYLVFAPFVAVYDDEEAREFAQNLAQWNDPLFKNADLTLYVDEFADRLHFNRYTGVVMR